MKKQFKISDEEIKTLYLSGKSMSEIAKIAQDTKGLMSIRKKLHELGVSTKIDYSRYSNRVGSNRIFSLNETVFDEINSSEKAYWLGFLYADGYNNEKKHRIEITLQPSDFSHLELFRQFLKTEIKVRTYITNGYTKATFGVTSKVLSKSLASQGCVKAKSHCRTYPNIPTEFNKDFIRGYFDGNGSFSFTCIKNEAWQLNFTGNYDFIITLKNILEKESRVNSTKLNTRKDKPSVSAHYSGKWVCKKILDYMYENATVYLQRKYDKYRILYLGGETRNNNKPRELMETPTSAAEDNHEPSLNYKEGATTIPKGSTLKRVEVRGPEKSGDDIV